MNAADRPLYVALGDSLSCPSVSARTSAWPELAARLLGEGISFMNLATAGATSADVEHEQLPFAVALQPDLVTVTCGANDVIQSARPDLAALAKRFDRILQRLCSSMSDPAVVTATYPDLAGVASLRPRTKRRIKRAGAELNERIRELAERHDLILLDWALDPSTNDPRLRASDGVHHSALGHQLIAVELVHRLGPDWRIRGG